MNPFEIFYQSSGICTDTRAIEPNCFFIAIKGDRFDGNTFAEKALEMGALHVIVDDRAYFTNNKTMTLVENSIVFLQELAQRHRAKFDIPVIGITGSNGKTTTKELMNTVLSKKYNVLATLGNLNNHLGVPLTLLRLRKEHEIAIIEMGANRFHDIEELCEISAPNYGIITNIGKAHLEGFIDFEGVKRTKKELYESVEENEGKIIYNEDDEILKSILPSNIQKLSYGRAKNCDVFGELKELNPFVCMTWGNKSFDSELLHTNMVGEYNFYNYLCAIAFGVEFGVDPIAISKAIEEYSPSNNRSQVKKTDKNTLILDCYNANPTSMRSALESFAMMKNQSSKVFIIGDMKELGDDSEQEHQSIIALVEKLNIKGYVVGEEFSKIQSDSIIENFQQSTDLSEYIRTHPIKDNLVLLKGSRSIKLEILEKDL